MKNEPLEVKVAALVRFALDRHRKLIEGGDGTAFEVTKIVDETTQKIIEDVLLEIKLGADAAKAEAEKRHQERERRFREGR